MTTRDRWYEELCRVFVADELGVPVNEVKSTTLDGVVFDGDPEDTSQIDLYVVLDEHEFMRLDVVIDAKWRGTRPVEKIHVRNWADIASSVRASKAMIISNAGFTAGAVAAAKSRRIALLELPPAASAMTVAPAGRREMSEAFTKLASKGEVLYQAKVITRSAEPPFAEQTLTTQLPGSGGPAPVPRPSSHLVTSNRAIAPSRTRTVAPSTRSVPSPPNRGGAMQSVSRGGRSSGRGGRGPGGRGGGGGRSR